MRDRGHAIGRLTTAALVLAAVIAAQPAPARAPALQAGVGRADITPPTGYFMLGWARGDARIAGQHTRLFARALALRAGTRKVALVAEDLNSIPGGMVQQAAAEVAGLGYTPENVVVSAGHTHAGPTGFSNFGFKNSVNPTPETPTTLVSDPDLLLYTFMVHRLAEAIRRADANLAPAVAGWGRTELLGVTHNRSLEAHLANHGIQEPPGAGRESQDPGGYRDTIAPDVDVLRVDRLVRGRRVPVAAWSLFADHGTVNKADFPYYNADHHGAAERLVEAALRRAGRVPGAQDVVNVYGNTTAGDMSAGLDRSGPAAAAGVGRREAEAMLAAWRDAGRHLARRPALDLRWTRVCFCGQAVDGGRLDTHAIFGLPYFTGSEEGRGPIYDLTGLSFEGVRLPGAVGVQGDKVIVRPDLDHSSVPQAVPLTAIRLGDRAIVTVPAEMTVEMGRRMRAAVATAMGAAGIARVVIDGYANEYVSYLTTPEEYAAQHYEGGTTLYGPQTGPFIAQQVASLAGRLARGEPAPVPYAFDPTNGLKPDGPAYPPGAAAGAPVAQPAGVERLRRATFSWRGGASGLDRPLDRAFVTVQRRDGRRWRPVADDLGLQILWTVADDNPHTGGTPTFAAGEQGTTTASWQVPLAAPAGTYRFVVTAARYGLTSEPFSVRASTALRVALERADPEHVAVRLAYPLPTVNEDVTDRPAAPTAGVVVANVDGHTVSAPVRDGRALVPARPGSTVTVAAGAARDRFGNTNAEAVPLR